MRTRSRRIALVVAVAVVMTVAGGLGTILVLEQKTGGASPVVDDGPTFYQVLSNVNESVRDTGDGPWSLFSVYGIAAQVPFSPNLIGYVHTNATVNSCSQAFDGVTLWNGTLPLFDGSFDSGSAPFWQLAYFSNSSQEILLVTDVMDAVHIYPAIAFPGPCMPWHDLPGNTANWTSPGLLPGVDSVAAAGLAWGSILEGKESVGAWVKTSEPMVEIMTVGPGMFQGFGDVFGGYGIFFDRCGELGAAGVQPMVVALVNSAGTSAGTFNITHNCALLNSGHGAYDADYDLLFSPASINVGSTTVLAFSDFQVAIASPNGTLGDFFDEIGLANWMTSWNLSTSSGSRLALTPSGCDSWVPSIADCSANPSGWYAVVLSASGEWINTYGALPSGASGWSEPVTALVSHQQLVVVMPSSSNLSGDTLTVNSTVTNTTVLGMLTL
jgi:hypothetical protein